MRIDQRLGALQVRRRSGPATHSGYQYLLQRWRIPFIRLPKTTSSLYRFDDHLVY
jgi:hypothetical protein